MKFLVNNETILAQDVQDYIQIIQSGILDPDEIQARKIKIDAERSPPANP